MEPPRPVVPDGLLSEAELYVLARWKVGMIEALLDHVFSFHDPVREAALLGMGGEAFAYLRAGWHERLTVDALVVWCHRARLDVRFPASTRI